MKQVKVILVDTDDNPVGLIGKMEAHRKGLLHRAISVFIINSAGEWILQKRAHDKYHSKGLWTNACCTHPLPGESEPESANRRLFEEMGIKTDLKKVFSFIYKEKLDNELTEHEYDHVFAGITDLDPVINTKEVVEWKRVSFKELHLDILKNPADYTSWFKKIYQDVKQHLLTIINE